MPANPYYEPSGVQFAAVAPNLTPNLAGMQPLKFGPGIQFQASAPWVLPEPKPYIAQGIEKGVGAVAQGITARYKNKKDEEKEEESKRRWEKQQNWSEYADWERLKLAKEDHEMKKQEHDLKMARERADAVGVGDGRSYESIFGGKSEGKPPTTPVDSTKSQQGITETERQADQLQQTPGPDLVSASDASRDGPNQFRDATPSAFQAQGLDVRPPSKYVLPVSLDTPVQLSEQMTIAGQPVERPSQLTQMQLLEPKKPTAAFLEQSMDIGEGALAAPATSSLANIDATLIEPKQKDYWQMSTPSPIGGKGSTQTLIRNEFTPVESRKVGRGGSLISNKPDVPFWKAPGTTVSRVQYPSLDELPQIRQQRMAALMGVNPAQAEAALMGIEAPARPSVPAPVPAPAPAVPGAPDTTAKSMSEVKAAQIMALAGSQPPKASNAAEQVPSAPARTAQAPTQTSRPQYMEVRYEDLPFKYRNLEAAKIMQDKMANDPRNPYIMTGISKTPDKNGIYHADFRRKDAPPEPGKPMTTFQEKAMGQRERKEEAANMQAAEAQRLKNPAVRDYGDPKTGVAATASSVLQAYNASSNPNNKSKGFSDVALVNMIAKIDRGGTPTDAEMRALETHRSLVAKYGTKLREKFTGDMLTQSERDIIAMQVTEVFNEKAERANEEIARYRMNWAGKPGMKDPLSLPAYVPGGLSADTKMLLKAEAQKELQQYKSTLIQLEQQMKTAPVEQREALRQRAESIKHEARTLGERIVKDKNTAQPFLKPLPPKDEYFAEHMEKLRQVPFKTNDDIAIEQQLHRTLMQASSFGGGDGNFAENIE